ncbi:MAG: GGDEF domain-containing protein [Gammaproteobacteria bacterium]
MSQNEDKLEFDFERISILFTNTTTGYVGIAAASCSMAFLIAIMATPEYAIAWLLAMFLSYVPRILLSISFKRKLATGEIDKNNIGAWENHFFNFSIVPFVCFALAVIIPYGPNILTSLLFYAIAMMALVAGGILTYSTSLPAIMLFLHVAMLPLIGRILFVEGILANALLVILIISYVMLIRLIPRQNRVLLENIALKIENRSQSLTDPLTRLANRRRLYLFMEDLAPVSERQKDPFTIVLLDVDHFKKYNDTYGHSAGDELLIKLARILTDCSRDQDLVVRYGGEEFLLVLPSTKLEAAKVVCNRISEAVKQQTDVTISGGLAMQSEGTPFEELIEQADAKLYEAKESGRDAILA